MYKHTKTFKTINSLILGIFSLFCAVPLLLILIVSFTEEKQILKHGYSLFPSQFSLDAYKMVFGSNSLVLNSLMISVIVTVSGTIFAVIITAMAGYSLANIHFTHRAKFALFFFITMIFNPGIVPWYILCTKIGLKNNIFALIIPSLIFNPFNLFLVRNYMKNIPNSIMEAALIDGASHVYIFYKIFVPLSKPVLATIALFYGIAYWNNWFNAIMLVDNERIFPLQYLLFRLKSYVTMISQLQEGASTETTPPKESFKMATSIITIGPIILFYPYLQKYIVKGIMIGSVKG